MRQLLAAAIVVAMLIVGVWLGFILAHLVKPASSQHEENTASVVQQVQTLSDLVTVKYVVEKVVILDDVKWYGESRVLLLAHGIVKAGIQLKRLQPEDVRISGKAIRLRLPLPQVTDAYLDDQQTRVIDHTTGLMREFDKDSNRRRGKQPWGTLSGPRAGKESWRTRRKGAIATGYVSAPGRLREHRVRGRKSGYHHATGL